MDNLIYWVWITQTFGVANHRIWEVLDDFHNVKEAYEALKSGEYPALTVGEKNSIKTTHLAQSKKLIDFCNSKEYRIIAFDDNGYPDRLRGIFNPPPILFCMGDLSYIDDEVVITVVGARHPSDYSIKFAKRICSELVKIGVVLVSGFALGIDSMAHRAALQNNSRTVAVLGCGLDVDYPIPNSDVKKVIAKRGAVITEFFPGTRPNGGNFPIRNRILSGLSLGTLVVEAGMQSGSLITAEHALQQGRDVFCVPPYDLFDEKCCGVIRLIRDGAIPTFSHLDIVYEYYENFSHKINSAESNDNYAVVEESCLCSEKVAEQRDSFRKRVKAQKSEKQLPAIVVDYDELTDEQAKIVHILEKNGATQADELASQAGMSSSDTLSLLTELELYGIVQAAAGLVYSLD
ncbi:MAG: DNA-processing protein DprA [Oscillospiraceae bacterium]